MDYKEMAAIVKERGDRIIEEKRARAVRIKRITSAVAGICAVAAAFVVWYSGSIDKLSPDDLKNPNDIIVSEETGTTVSKNTTTYVNKGNNTTQTKAVVTTYISETNASITSAVTEKNQSDKTKINTTGTAVTHAIVTARTSKTTSISNKSNYTYETGISKKTEIVVTTNAYNPEENIIVTTIPVEIKPPGRERSYYMKLLSKKFAEMLTAATLVVTPSTSVAPGILSNPLNVNDYTNIDGWDPTERFAEFRNDENIIDVNADGKFDIKDVYIYWSITHGDRSLDKEVYTLDVDLNGTLNDYDDSKKMIDYFLFYNELLPEYFDRSYYKFSDEEYNYKIKDDTIAKEFWNNYVNDLEKEASLFHCFKGIFNNKVANKKIDLDVSGDGVFDLGDVYDMFAFENMVKHSECAWNIIHKMSFSEGRKAIADYIDENGGNEMYERCLAICDELHYKDKFKYDIGNYALLYFFENNTFLPEYTDDNYYESLRDYGTRENKMLMRAVYAYCEGIGIEPTDMRTNVDTSNITEEYEKYLDRLKNGTAKEPDVDLDGKITFSDYYIINRVFWNRYRNDDVITEKIRINFLNKLDLNMNGISGDCLDCMIVQTYICEKFGITETSQKNYEYFKYEWYYNDSLDSIWSKTKIKNCLIGSIYPLTDPDDWVSLSEMYISEFKYTDRDERNKVIARYCDEIDAGRLPVPDVDMNGVFDENDYYAAEITRYSQTHTDLGIDIIPLNVMKNYVMNFDLDGSGVSGDAVDTQIILYYAERKTDIHHSDLENKIDVILGYAPDPDPFMTTTSTMPAFIYGTFGYGYSTTTTTTKPIETPETKRSGDANNNGVVKMNDAVLIMQNVANPDEYKMTDAGEYNADVHNTGDGITNMDALSVQKMLLRSNN